MSGTTTPPTIANMAFSPAPNPYTSSVPASGTVAWLNPNSFQILCAGVDRQWGLGGIYLQNSPSGSPIPPLPAMGTTASEDPGVMHSADSDLQADGTPNKPKTGVRLREYDNITNFKGGRLQ